MNFQPLYLNFHCWEQAEEQPQEALPESLLYEGSHGSLVPSASQSPVA